MDRKKVAAAEVNKALDNAGWRQITLTMYGDAPPKPEGAWVNGRLTEESRRVMSLALRAALHSGKNYIEPEHISEALTRYQHTEKPPA